jgi:fatty-acyl-CoA synthase
VYTGETEKRDLGTREQGVETSEFCNGQIAYYKIPEHIRFVDEFPTTLSGKIQKYKIREFEIEARGLQQVARTATA